MKYLCLRNCFVGGIYWVKGKIYELPDGLEKSPKNFRALEEPAPVETPKAPPKPITSPGTETTAADSGDVVTDVGGTPLTEQPEQPGEEE